MDNNIRWLQKYEYLKEYIYEHGDSRVPQNYVTKNGIALGKWADTQRQLKRKGKLKPGREALLEDVDFVWVVRNGTSLSWDDWFKLLLKYKKTFGNTDVPSKYVTPDGYKLGYWVETQNKANAGLIPAEMTVEHFELLDALGHKWFRREDNWNMKYEEIERCFRRDPNWILTKGQKTWISYQKTRYKNGELSNEEAELLTSIGINLYGHGYLTRKQERKQLVGDIQIKKPRDDEEIWIKHFNELYKQYMEHNCNIDLTIVLLDKQTKSWLAKLYKKYKNYENIPKYRIKALNDMFIDWSYIDTRNLNKKIVDNLEYKKILLERMKHILEDLSYEMDGSITDISKQKEIEKEIIKRMWR